MADTLRVTIVGKRLADAVALDCASYIAENPGNTNGDIAAMLGIAPEKLSEMKSGKYQPRLEQAISFARFGMGRLLATANEIAEEARTLGSMDALNSRVLEKHVATSKGTAIMLDAVRDGRIDKSEHATCRAALLDELNTIQQTLRALDAVAVS